MLLEDLPWYAQFAGDPNIMRYIGRAGPLTRDEAIDRLARYVRCWEEHELGMFSARLRGEESPIGWGGLQPLSGTAEIEVGYAFEKATWGCGYATELASAVVQWGFEERHLERIVAVASAENAASRRVMDKLGMRYEGVRPGSDQESVLYSLTPEAFAQAASLRAGAL